MDHDPVVFGLKLLPSTDVNRDEDSNSQDVEKLVERLSVNTADENQRIDSNRNGRINLRDINKLNELIVLNDNILVS